MKNLFLLILILVGAAFAAKVYIEKQYESKLDEAISLARAVVDIRYKDIKVDFDGSISINDLSITPTGIDESVTIQKITAISSDRMLPIKGAGVFKDGQFPETFELNFRQASVPMSLVDKSQQALYKGQKTSDECRSFGTSFNYSAAGYSRIHSDLRMAFDFGDVYNAAVNIDMFDQTSSLALEWIFDANQIDELVTRQTSQLPISEISATYELEQDAASRFIEQCAGVFSVTPEIFLEKVVGSAKYSENSIGVDLGPEMRQALVKFMQGGSQFSFKSKPDLQLKKIDQLQFYKPKDILRWLNLELALDGEALPFNAAVLAAEEREAKKEVAKAKAEALKPEYFKALASNADNYINRWVRIKRSNQRKPLEGRLEGIDADGRLMVQMYKHGGLMILTVGYDEIEALEVRNR